jgi:hypothetical protein
MMFQVYELIDPRVKQKWPYGVFYVGEGVEKRARQSGTVGGSVGQKKKLAIVKAIIASGAKPVVRIAAECATKEDAIDKEAEHYERLTLVYGLKLANKTVPLYWAEITAIVEGAGKREPPKFMISTYALAKGHKRSYALYKDCWPPGYKPPKWDWSSKKKPPLEIWCGEASGYTRCCPLLPYYCIPRPWWE